MKSDKREFEQGKLSEGGVLEDALVTSAPASQLSSPESREGELLRVDNLGFSYANHEVLKGISFALNRGEVVALLGPNGVGKSTLFRCVLGFLKGYTGQVYLQGDSIVNLDTKAMAKHIAYIPQISKPVFEYSVLELVLMGLASSLPTFASPSVQEEARALAILESLGIGHLAYVSSAHISGGEYQLALLARALLQEAQVLVMDEPTANLDYGNQFRVMMRVQDLAARGLGVLMSSHDPNQVLQHASRVLVIKGGRLLSQGFPRDVMTPDLLTELYDVEVRRCEVEEEIEGHTREVSLCYPASMLSEE